MVQDTLQVVCLFEYYEALWLVHFTYRFMNGQRFTSIVNDECYYLNEFCKKLKLGNLIFIENF